VVVACILEGGLRDAQPQMPHAQKPLVYGRNALKRHFFMLWTTANPIDGLRFERDAQSTAESRTS